MEVPPHLRVQVQTWPSGKLFSEVGAFTEVKKKKKNTEVQSLFQVKVAQENIYHLSGVELLTRSREGINYILIYSLVYICCLII